MAWKQAATTSTASTAAPLRAPSLRAKLAWTRREPAEPAGQKDGGREGHEQDQDGGLALDPEQEQRRQGQGGKRQECRHGPGIGGVRPAR